jgi:hypothetical protein
MRIGRNTNITSTYVNVKIFRCELELSICRHLWLVCRTSPYFIHLMYLEKSTNYEVFILLFLYTFIVYLTTLSGTQTVCYPVIECLIGKHIEGNSCGVIDIFSWSLFGGTEKNYEKLVVVASILTSVRSRHFPSTKRGPLSLQTSTTFGSVLPLLTLYWFQIFCHFV